MPATSSENPWRSRLLKPRFGLTNRALRPAEIAEFLCDVSLAGQNVIEDVNYQKIVPNRYVVELAGDDYENNYRLLKDRICEQWRNRLLAHINNANSRQGRREFRFAGQVSVDIRPADSLSPGQARVLFRLDPQSQRPSADLPACLERLHDGKRYALRAGVVTLGRTRENDIVLDDAEVQEKKLVSGQHAHLRCSPGQFRIFDGTPLGVLSTNGTFVNNRPVPPGGLLLHDGDEIRLAAIDPDAPDLDTPGSAVFRFHEDCSA